MTKTLKELKYVIHKLIGFDPVDVLNIINKNVKVSYIMI